METSECTTIDVGIDNSSASNVPVREDRKFSALMTNVGYSETVAVGGTERGFIRRSCVSLCRHESEQRYKVELELGSSRLRATTFAETLQCYGPDSTRRHYRSAVEYQPQMIPVRYSDTQYVLPKRLTSTYISNVDVSGPGDPKRPRWYQSSVDVQPLTVSNVIVVGFQWLSDVDSLPDADVSRSASEIDDI